MKYAAKVLALLVLCTALLASGSVVFAKTAAKNSGKEVFGFIPGSAFPETLRDRLQPGEDGFLQYQAECPDPDWPFKRIKVRVSPRSHVVIDVSAAGIFHDCSKGSEALWPLKSRLEADYGKAVKKKQSDGERFEIKKGKLHVVFYLRSATFEEHCILYADFMDLEAYKKYGKEAQAALEEKPAGPQP